MKLWITILIVYFLINYISFHISLYFIFDKSYVNKNMAFIPLVSLYYFMKICRINPIWIYIPVLNIVIFIVSPWLLGYHFSQPRWLRYIGLLFPAVFFQYIAFSKKAVYIHRKISNLNLQSIHDIDNLEDKIKRDVIIYDSDDIPEDKKKQMVKKELKEMEQAKKLNYIDMLDMKLGQMQADDIVVTDEDLLNPIQPTKDKNVDENIKREELVLDYDYEENDNLNSNDTFDDISNADQEVGLSDIKSIENSAIESNKKEYTDNADYKELEANKKSVEAIAFNINEEDIKDENKITVLDSKSSVKDLKCPRCNSSLIGFHDYCPGCGLDIKDLVNEK